MKPGIPWSVKGIDGRAREVAKDAARAEGLTLGEWLNQKILESAQEDAELTARATRKKSASSVSRRPARQPRRESAPSAEPGITGDNAVARKLDELFERIASLQVPAQPVPAVASAPAPCRPEPVESGASVYAMQQLLDRIETGEKRTHASLDMLGDRVERLGFRVDEIAERPVDIKARDIPGFSALEGAVRNIVEHISKSEAQSRETMSSLQGRLSELNSKIDTPAKPAGVAPDVISTLERRMADLAAQVESVAGSVGDDKLKQVFEARIRELAERIDTVRHSAEAMGQKAEATASEAARRQAEAIEQRMAALVAEAEQKLSGSAEGDSRLAEIHAEIGKLHNRFEEIRLEAASEHEVQALRSALEQLSSRVEEAPGLEPIAQIEQRIAELSEQLEAVSYPAADLQPQIGQLEQRIQALDTQIASSAGAAQADPALTGQIAQIEQRLAATEQQLGSLGTIENSIQQLFASLEQSRAETRELISGMGAGTPESGDETPPSELKALQDGLAAVRANAEAADQRTQETLEAVHETLAQIIDKLGELDRSDGASHSGSASGIDEIAASAAAAAAAMAAAGAPAAGVMDAGQPAPAAPEAGIPDYAQATFSPFEDPASVDAQTAAATAPMPQPAPAPAQTGQGNNDWLSVVRAHMTQHHGGAGMQSMNAAPAHSAGAGHVDFIAAARRAAAAAAPHSPAGATLSAGGGFGDIPPMGEADDVQQSRLASLLSRKGQKQSGKADAGKADDKASSRKRLVLAALVLLTAVSAYAVNSGMLLKKPTKQSNLSRPAVTQQIEPVKQAAVESTSTVANKIELPANAAPVELPQPEPAATAAAMDATPAADPLTTASIAPAQSDPMLAQQRSPLGQALSTTASTPVQAAELPEQIGTAELRQAAQGGDARAQFIVASRYLEGRMVGRDHEAAAYWYTKAANGGLSAAQYRIGTLYERGSGVSQDKLQAISWYAKAAEQGNVKAMHNLAVLSADSTVGKPDMARAAKWFGAAAAYGLPDSQYNYAVLNERGLGVQKNANEAYKWYLLAARQGDRDAISKAEALKGQLDGGTVASITQLVETWKPEPAIRDANMVSVSEPSWGVDQPSRQASAGAAAGTAPVPVPMNAQPVQTLTAKDQVKLAQQLLAQKGFDPGVADGEMGSRTANAIRLYQLRNGLPVNGSVSKQLLDHLQQGTI